MARCPRTGAVGAAVATFSVNVGRVSPLYTGLTPRFEASGGMIFVHSSVSLGTGQVGLDALRSGRDLDEVIDAMASHDSHWAWRQVTVMRPSGEVRVVTGTESAGPWAGDRSGDGWTVSGNALRGAGVVDAMASAVVDDGAALSERLMRTLEAGRAAGGQADPKTGEPLTELSAVLLVFDGERAVPRVDLRIDYDPLAVPRLRALHDYTGPVGDYYDAMELCPDAMISYLRERGVYDAMPHFRQFRDPKTLTLRGYPS
ncbi:MAG: DUF1028 domain-containing protein [Acidimicrobiales bacterium]